MQIKLLVACEERRRASGLCARLVKASAGCIAADAAEIDGVLRRAAVARPDVLLLEYIQGEDQRAKDVLSRVSQASAGTRVLMLCQAYTHGMIIGFIQHGASGCLLQSSELALYAKAVRTVHEGGTWFGRTQLLQALRRQVVAQPLAMRPALDQLDLLTAREREIMALIGDAMSNKEIARQLKISDKTVKTHLHHIYVKLHKSGRYKALLSNVFTEPAPSSPATRVSQASQHPGFAGK